MLGSVVHDWFGWPNGAVLTNLIASLVWGVVAWRKLRAMHKHIRIQHKHILKLHDHLGVESDDLK